jgi:hypothetical protein
MCLTIIICRLFKNGQLLNDVFCMTSLQNPKIFLDTLVHVPKEDGYLIETFIDCENFTLRQQPNDDFQVIFFLSNNLLLYAFFYCFLQF